MLAVRPREAAPECATETRVPAWHLDWLDGVTVTSRQPLGEAIEFRFGQPVVSEDSLEYG